MLGNWKRVALFGLGTLCVIEVAQGQSPGAIPKQNSPPTEFVAGPSGTPFADPFYSPPDGLPVMDSSKPGSGAAPSDSLVPAPAPFRPERVWFATDFYHAAGQGTLLPPLVTAAPAGTPLGTAGALGQSPTAVLFGGRKELNEFRPGLRATGGLWLTEDSRFGLDGSFLYLGDARRSFEGSTGSAGPVLAQPVTFAPTGAPLGVPVGTLGMGTLSARAQSAVIGGDANFRYGLTTSEMGRLDLLVGYRYLNLRDSVDVSSIAGIAGSPLLSTSISDGFRTLNQFHGAQVGLGGTHRLFGRLTLTTKIAAAIGVNLSDVKISGETFSPLGHSATGLLTGAGNIGNFREHYFAVVPEGTAKFGWDFTDRIRLNAGYSFLYWTRVRRAADQIDTTVGSASRPRFAGDTTGYWIQGYTLGLDLRY